MEMAQEASPSMEDPSMIRLSPESTHVQDYYRWPTAEETPTQVNFS